MAAIRPACRVVADAPNWRTFPYRLDASKVRSAAQQELPVELGDARGERVRFEWETASVVEDGKAKLTEMIRIDDYFGFHDLFTFEFEAQHTRQASARSQNDSH